jgi:hypothetical protein
LVNTEVCLSVQKEQTVLKVSKIKSVYDDVGGSIRVVAARALLIIIYTVSLYFLFVGLDHKYFGERV